MKFYYIFFISIILSVCAQAQQTSYTFDTPIHGTQDYFARDFIEMNPGFIYEATPGNRFSASIGENFVWDMSYEDNPLSGTERELSTSKEVGSIPGSYSVSPNGGLSYTIPIEVPPGVNGIAPSLVITYSNNAGNGLLGWGWNLSGLSYITRGTKSLYQEGEINTVSFSNEDRFFLNGQRLICTSGDYGLANSEYRTEIDNSSKVILLDDANGNSYFEVHTPQGMIMIFKEGFHAEQTNAIIYWAISEIQDLNGNSIFYNYRFNNNELNIENISYAGNTIEFAYAERDDDNFKYINGERIENNTILKGIIVNTEGENYRNYGFNYSKNLYSYLYEITLSDGLGNEVNSTIIDWEKFELNISNHDIDLSFGSAHQYLGDFNGDGIKDILVQKYHEDGDEKVYTSVEAFIKNDENFENYLVFNIEDDNYKQIYVLDRDNDGKDEVYKLYVCETFIDYQDHIELVNKYSYLCYEFDDNSFGRGDKFFVIGTSPESISPFLIHGDFNGDSRLDIIAMKEESGSLSSIYSNFSLSGGHLNVGLSIEGTNLRVINFNGNKKLDIYVEPSGNVLEFNNATGRFVTIAENTSNQISELSADFNGDGLMDYCPAGTLLHPSTESQDFNIMLSTGNGFASQNSPFTVTRPEHFEESMFYQEIVLTNDVNGDGKSDIIRLHGRVDETIEPLPLTITYSAVLLAHLYISTGSEFISYDISNIFSGFECFSGTVTIGNYDDLDLIKWEASYCISKYMNRVEEKIRLFRKDFTGDGLGDILLYNPNTFQYRLISFSENKPGYVSSITNGMNIHTNFTYATLHDSEVYTLNSEGETNGIKNIMSTNYVVKSVELSDENVFAKNNYHYTNVKLHKEFDFLGFGKFKTSNTFTNISSEIEFEFIGERFFQKPKNINVSLTSGGEILTTTFINDDISEITAQNDTKYLQARITQKTITDHLTSTNVTTSYNSYNNFNQPAEIVTAYGSDMTITKSNDFEPIGNKWLPLRLQSQTVTRKHKDDAENYVSTTTYTYVSGKEHLLDEKTVHAGTDKELTEKFEYKDFGAVKKISLSDGTETRSTEYFYTANKYIESKTINENFPVSYTYNDIGNLLSQTDHNDLTQIFSYGAFNALEETSYADGTITSITKNWSTAGPTGTTFMLQSSTSEAGTITEYYNVKGHLLQKKLPGVLDKTFKLDYEYYPDGKLFREYEPYENTREDYTEYVYDAYGRVIEQITPQGTITTQYPGKNINVTSPSGWSEKTFDDFGLMVKAKDAGGTINYSYKSIGMMQNVNYGTDEINLEYDQAGNRTRLDDPNAGNINTVYNAFGELLSETNDRGYQKNYVYDEYGRMLTQTCDNETNTYVYDPVTGNLTGILGAYTNIHYTYDNLQRPITKAEDIDGENFITTYSYGNYSKLNSTIYNGGLEIVYGYDIHGNITQLYKAGDNNAIWNLDDVNNKGQITSYSYGNGIPTDISYDPKSRLSEIKADDKFWWKYGFDATTGNLNYRKNEITTKQENFLYDELNRLTSYYDGSVSYTNDGNIASKTSAGYYSYNSILKNAVENVSVEDPGNGGNDPGKQNKHSPVIPTEISRFPQNIDYNWFNKPIRILQENYEYNFTFGPDQQRKKMEVYENRELVKTKYYSGNYEKIYDEKGNYKEYTYISTASGLVAVNIKDSRGIEDLYYIHTDYLGSIMALTSESGGLIEEYHYDAWGRRRNPATWNFPNTQSLKIDRGYTGHEHLDDVDLINMNGRMYDPLLGRMLSPDNYIQLPGFTQSLNRFSYVMNNPLKYTDPTGEKWWHWLLASTNLISYIQGAEKHDWDWNPSNWDWSQSSFRFGVEKAGDSYNVYFGYGWDPNFIPTAGYDTDKGFGVGYTDMSGENYSYHPGYNYSAPEQNAAEAIDIVRGIYMDEWHAASYSEINQWNPSWVDRWSESTKFFKEMSYDLVDGVWVTSQSLVRGPNATHLTGEIVGGNDRMNSFMNTTTWGLTLYMAPTRISSFSSGPSRGYIVRNGLGDGFMYLDRGVTRTGYRYSIKYGQRIRGKEFWRHLFDWK